MPQTFREYYPLQRTKLRAMSVLVTVHSFQENCAGKGFPRILTVAAGKPQVNSIITDYLGNDFKLTRADNLFYESESCGGN